MKTSEQWIEEVRGCGGDILALEGTITAIRVEALEETARWTRRDSYERNGIELLIERVKGNHTPWPNPESTAPSHPV